MVIFKCGIHVPVSAGSAEMVDLENVWNFIISSFWILPWGFKIYNFHFPLVHSISQNQKQVKSKIYLFSKKVSGHHGRSPTATTSNTFSTFNLNLDVAEPLSNEIKYVWSILFFRDESFQKDSTHSSNPFKRIRHIWFVETFEKHSKQLHKLIHKNWNHLLYDFI